MEFEKALKMILKIYNGAFELILVALILGVILYGVYLHFAKEEYVAYYVVCVKREIYSGLVQMFIVIGMLVCLEKVFRKDMLLKTELDMYWRVVVGGWILLHILSGNKFYNRLKFQIVRNNTIRGEYTYLSPEKILLHEIEMYDAYYELADKKRDTLKSLAPVSLLPVITGYIFEGKEMNIDWNSYTIVFIGGLLVYLYSLWKCYRDMDEWKRRGLDIKEDLMKVEYKKEKQQREIEENNKIENPM